MKLLFYPRLALSGIRKNSRLYTPFLLTCVGVTAMYTIFLHLKSSPAVARIPGGGTLGLILSLGCMVIWTFALIFLAYTHSFLLRRRKREFGLYSVLGMGKRALTWLIAWENLLVAGISLTAGLLLGVLLSKLAELGLCRIAHVKTDFFFWLDARAVLGSVEGFVPIFAFLFCNSVFQVRRSDPLELLSSEAVGEKPPRANYLLALLGAVLLGVAYYTAVRIDNPLSAIVLFFGAVLLVIFATYLLFIAGSVALCRILQKNRRYYYQKNHFVSVSTMVYRMKRNGAGLASICILSTMVLVMLTTTVNLYLGTEQTVRLRNIRDNTLVIFADTIDQLSSSATEKMQEELDGVLEESNIQPEDALIYRYQSTSMLLRGNKGKLTPDGAETANVSEYGMLYNVYFVSAEDYARATGISYSLAPGEAAACSLYSRLDFSQLFLGEELELNIARWIDWKLPIPDANTGAVNSLMLVIPDYETLSPLHGIKTWRGADILWSRWVYAYNCTAPAQTQICLQQEQLKLVNSSNAFPTYDGGRGYMESSVASDREEIYGFTGGMLFLGMTLSLVFLLAAVLIIYYKQISEGYEDQGRFEIMQKVGMTKQDIRRSIDSQVLTVFFAPLLAAGVHLCFAFPMLEKILRLFAFCDMSKMVLNTLGIFGLFCGCYALVYKATASAYFTIVSGGQKSR